MSVGEPMTPEVSRSEPVVRFVPPEQGIARLVIDRPDDTINAINLQFIADLEAAVRQAHATSGLAGLVVESGKPGQFVAGADLDLLLQATGREEIEAAARALQRALDDLAALPGVTVAAIGGPALGGGYEIALACDWRVAADSPAVSVGLPEVQLGLIPAAGGTQRLPRLVGLAKGLELILGARRLDARRARRAGLLDEVVHPTVLAEAAAQRVRLGKRRAGAPRPLAARLLEATPLGRRLIYRQARARVLAETRGHYPAPLRALDAVATGWERGLAAGLAAEVRALGELATGPVARNLIALFLATQRQRRDRGVDEPDVAPRRIERVGVVGAGFMGSAIAELAAAAGLTVRLRDLTVERVAAGLANARKLVEEGVRRGRFDRRQAQETLARLSGATDYSGFGRADLVIEAVFEDLAVKQQVVRELEAVVGPETVIASNTSALPIARIAAAAQRPERVVGMHFFSPAHRMPLLEVVRAEPSAPWAVATAVEAGKRLGKTVIVVRDGPGFYTTRVLGVLLNEAGLLLEEGASIEAVDGALVAFGFPVGPFALLDEVGLDVAAHAGQTLAEAFGERLPRPRGVPKLVELGRLGRKSGRGFYRYDGRRKRPDPEVYALLGSPARRPFAPEQLQDRLVLLFVNEAVRCLGEGVLRSATDGDLGAVLGLGFPPFHGGPFRYADQLGLERLRDRLEELRAAHGERFAPAPLLVELAGRGAPFH